MKKILKIILIILAVIFVLAGFSYLFSIDYNKIYASILNNFANQWKDYLISFLFIFIGHFLYKHLVENK